METTLLDFIKANWYYILAGIVWFVLAITNQKYRDRAFETIFNTVEKKEVKVDLAGHSFTLYTKGDLKKIGPVVRKVAVEPVSHLVIICKDWSYLQWNNMNSEPEKPVRKFWYFFALLLFLAFIWADGVAIYNSMSISSLKANVPEFLIPWLSPYDLAVAFASLICLVIVFLIFADLVGRAGITDWVEANGWLKGVGIAATLVLAISAISVMLGMAGVRFGVLANLTPEQNNFNNFLFNLSMSYLVPANVVGTTVLITHDAIKGAWMIFLAFLEVIFSALYVGHYVLNIVAALGNVGVEFLIFVIFIIILAVFFLAFTPFLMLWGLLPPRKGTTSASGPV